MDLPVALGTVLQSPRCRIEAWSPPYLTRKGEQVQGRTGCKAGRVFSAYEESVFLLHLDGGN